MSVGSSLAALKNCLTAFGRSETGNSHHWSQAGVKGSAPPGGHLRNAMLHIREVVANAASSSRVLP